MDQVASICRPRDGRAQAATMFRAKVGATSMSRQSCNPFLPAARPVAGGVALGKNNRSTAGE